MNLPAFPQNAAWLNSDCPFSWEDLKGHIVILDFWTYCCINCIHILPDLKWLEHRYADKPVMVIGVHSAKFNNENITEHVQSAVERYEIEHPVLVDFKRELWDKFGIRAWPSFVVVGPDGKIIEQISGEGIREPLNTLIQKLLDKGKKEGTLASKKITWHKPVPQESLLSFPGKMAIAESLGQLFIADSNHNRILQVQLEAFDKGKVVQVIGSGKKGRTDGSFKEASFFRPQGIYFDAETKAVFVCDTENHLIRQIDLVGQTVTTLAGTGSQAEWRLMPGLGLETSLNSPWDCLKVGPKLYIAMAGSHQIIALDLKTNRLSLVAGSGQENIVDGPGPLAQLAQPSGLTTDGTYLYVADSEVSAIRRVHLITGEVETLVGKGLFEFGQVDGPFDQALLQHCLGVSYWNNLLFIADTYNHAIRVADLNQDQLVSLIYRPENSGVCMIGDQSCQQLPLYEPNDVKVIDHFLYIADTNNHLIRVFDLIKKELKDFIIQLEQK